MNNLSNPDFIKEEFKNYPRPSDGVFDFLPKDLNKIKAIEVNTYSQRADKFNEEKILKGNFSELRLFSPIINQGKEGKLFLEIGGGDGRFALSLMKQGYKVVETDIAPGSVKKARYFAEKSRVADDNYFMAVDAENLPFKNEVFDGIFMVASLHHLPDNKKALTEIYRVVKEGSPVLILREPAAWFHYIFWPVIMTFRWLIRKRNKGEAKSLADDITMGFSRGKLKRIFKAAGFSEIKITPVDYLRKYHTYFCYIRNRLFKHNLPENEKINQFLTKTDKTIAKIPLLNELAWDWDSVMYKK
ncbi:MAG: class I SAM-dependent methyltransferase [Patescibacteria group bacterium]